MVDQLTKEYLNAIARRHKRKARRRKYLKSAPAKPQVSGAAGVADAGTPQSGT